MAAAASNPPTTDLEVKYEKVISVLDEFEAALFDKTADKKKPLASIDPSCVRDAIENTRAYFLAFKYHLKRHFFFTTKDLTSLSRDKKSSSDPSLPKSSGDKFRYDLKVEYKRILFGLMDLEDELFEKTENKERTLKSLEEINFSYLRVTIESTKAHLSVVYFYLTNLQRQLASTKDPNKTATNLTTENRSKSEPSIVSLSRISILSEEAQRECREIQLIAAYMEKFREQNQELARVVNKRLQENRVLTMQIAELQNQKKQLEKHVAFLRQRRGRLESDNTELRSQLFADLESLQSDSAFEDCLIKT